MSLEFDGARNGKMVRISADEMRASGTLDARKIRSPNGMKVQTSSHCSRRLWERVADRDQNQYI